MGAKLIYDNIPTDTVCSHCTERARWWVLRILQSGRERRYNLCDKHLGLSLRKDAGLTNLTVEHSSSVRADATL